MHRLLSLLFISVSLVLLQLSPEAVAQYKTDTEGGSIRGATTGFSSLNVPGGQATWISPDGSTVVGIFAGGGGGWVWTAATGAVVLPGSASAAGLAGNDFPAVGTASNPDEDGREEAAIWSAIDAEPQFLGGLPGAPVCDATLSTGYGISADGSTVVGLAYGGATPCSDPVAFVWTETDGMVALPKLNEDRFSRANGISADGSIIWGWNDNETGYRRAVRWVNGEIEELVDTEGNQIGEASGASRDATVIVGNGLGIEDQWSHAYRWTEETGAVSIGDLADWILDSNFAFATNDDGTIIGGATGFGPSRDATIWTAEAEELMWLTDFLAELEIEVPAGWHLNTVTAISADGRFIAGWGSDGTALNSFLIDLGSSSQGPENDHIADAVGIPIANTTYEGTNVNATLEDGEPEPSCTFGSWTTNYSVWWTFTAEEVNRVTINTFGSDFDTILSLHRVDDLSEVACNDDTEESLQSKIEDAIIQDGETYLIRVAGYNQSASNQGDISLTVDFHWVSSEPTFETLVTTLTAPSPNPVRGMASFSLTVDREQNVSVEVFDVMGRRVHTLYSGSLIAGAEEAFSLDTTNLSAGMYIIRAVGEDFLLTRRITVIR